MKVFFSFLYFFPLSLTITSPYVVTITEVLLFLKVTHVTSACGLLPNKYGIREHAEEHIRVFVFKRIHLVIIIISPNNKHYSVWKRNADISSIMERADKYFRKGEEVLLDFNT